MIRLRELLGATLRRRRLAQGRTLRQVAAPAGISLTYLSEIERGRKEPSSEVLVAVCDALGAVLSDVLFEVAETVTTLEALETAKALSAPDTTVGLLPRAATHPAGQPHASTAHAARVYDFQAYAHRRPA